MARRLFILLSAASLFLCVATCVLSARSRRAPDFTLAGGPTDGRLWNVCFTHYFSGALWVQTGGPWPHPGVLCLRPGRDRDAPHAPGEVEVSFVTGSGGRTDVHATAGRTLGVAHYSGAALPDIWWYGPSDRGVRPVRTLGAARPVGYLAVLVPAWMAAAVAGGPGGLILAVRAARRLRRRRGRGTGLCPACGYDLRASPGRCPECGARPKGVAA